MTPEDKNKPVEKWGRGLIYFLILVVPLVFLPDMGVTSSWETPRRLILFVVSGLLFFSIAEKISVSGRLALRHHALDIPVLLLLLAAWITGITGIYPAISLTGPVWSQFGLLFMGCGYLLYFAVKEYITTEEEVEKALRLLVISGAMVALFGLLDFFFFKTNPIMSGVRLIGTIGNAMFAGSFLALCILPAIFLWPRANKRWRIILAACLVLLLPALYLTQARGAWLGLLIAAIIMGIVIGMTKVKKKALYFGGWAVFALLVAALFILPAVRTRVATLVSERDTVLSRLVYMQAAVNMFKERPIRGWGTGNYQYLLTQFRPVTTASEGGIPINRGFSYAQAHCMPLQIAAEMGLLGLLPFLALLALLVIYGLHAATAPGDSGMLALALIGGVATYFVTMLSSFDNGATLMAGWVLISLLASLGAQERVIKRWAVLSPLWGKLFHVKAFVGGMVVVALAVMQLLAAYYMKRAEDISTQVDKLSRTDLPAARLLADDVLANYERATIMTPMLGEPEMGVHSFNTGVDGLPLEGPGEFGIISFGDEATWRVRTYMQRNMIDLGKQEDMDGAFYMMNVAGKMTLRVTDRNDIMFVLIREYLRFNKIKDARELMNKGLVYAPNSSDTHLSNSQILLREKQPVKALAAIEIAYALDPTYEALQVQFGNVYSELASSGNVPSIEKATRAVEYYHRAMDKKVNMDRRDRLDYALASFMLGNFPEATRQGMMLRGTAEAESLKTTLTELGNSMGRQEQAREVILNIM